MPVMPLGTWLLLVAVAAVGVLFVRNLIRNPAEAPVGRLPAHYRPDAPRGLMALVGLLSFALFVTPAFAVVSKVAAALATPAFAAALFVAARRLLRVRHDQMEQIGIDVARRAAAIERGELEQLVKDLERAHGPVMRPLRELVPLAELPEVAG